MILFNILPYLYSVNIDIQNKPLFMYYLTETILPVLFTCLVAYFIGSVARLFIHLLISDHANS